MEDKDLIALTETTERAKSNSHQIKEIKNEIKEIKSEQRALFEIATSVKLIANDMGYMKESIDKVSRGQEELSNKVDEQIQEVKRGQDTLEQKISEVDDKSKIDSVDMNRKYIESNWLKIAAGIGGAGGIAYILYDVLTKALGG